MLIIIIIIISFIAKKSNSKSIAKSTEIIDNTSNEHVLEKSSFTRHTKDHQENLYHDRPPICNKYRRGKCMNKNDCKFSHPPKCINYCRYGRDGCPGGFSHCKLLHPVLCRRSLQFMECLNTECTLTHLKGTVRAQNHNRHFHQQQPQHFDQNHGMNLETFSHDLDRPLSKYTPPMHVRDNLRQTVPPKSFTQTRNFVTNGYNRRSNLMLPSFHSNPSYSSLCNAPINVPQTDQSNKAGNNNFLEIRECIVTMQNQINSVIAKLSEITPAPIKQ